MRAILAFELRLLRGGTSVLLFTLGTVGVLALAFLLGRLTPFATEAAIWIAPLVLLLLLWREHTVQRRLDALVGSIPLGPADLLAGHLLFWCLVAFVPALALGLLEQGGRGSGLAPPITLFTLRMWCWFCFGVCYLGSLTGGIEPGPAKAQAGLFVLLAVGVMTILLPVRNWGSPTLLAFGIAVNVVFAFVVIRARASIEFLPTLTPKRVRVGESSKPTRGRAVPWRRRRDREGVRQARARNARSPRATLIHLLTPLWLVPLLGIYVSGIIGVTAQRAGLTAAFGLVVLLVMLHVHLHLSLPRWRFLRHTPLPGRRILLWLLVPLLLALVPSALVMQHAPERDGRWDFAPRAHASWLGLSDMRVLRVPRALRKPLEHATGLPLQLPSAQDLQFLREPGQAPIQDEAAYFDQVVAFFLRTRFHVAPAPGELRRQLGEPQPPGRIAALAMWEGKRDAAGELFVEGEFPLDLRPELVSRRFELMQRARGDHLPSGATPADSTARLEYEAEVAEVLTAHKQDGAVYEFGESLLRVWTAFEGRIHEARTRRQVLDLVAFVAVLLASLRWALRDPASRWLAPLVGGALILAWAQLAWWPLGTAVYVWSLAHFGWVLAGGLVLVAVLLVAFVRALRTMEAPAVESL